MQRRSFYTLSSIFQKVNEGFQTRPAVFSGTLPTSLMRKRKTVNLRNKILLPLEMNETVFGLFSKIFDADAILNEPDKKIDLVLCISKPSLKTIFMGAFDKNSIVFISALRFGVVTIICRHHCIRI